MANNAVIFATHLFEHNWLGKGDASTFALPKRSLAFVVTAGLCVLAAWASLPAYSQPQLALPPMKTPPVIDGVINPGEWNGSGKLSGLGSPMDARAAYAWVGYGHDNLYLAFQTEMPPSGELVTNIRRRGGEVIQDDCVELWIVPPEAGRNTDGPKGQGYFQLLVNSIGTIYDRHHEPGFGLSASAWNVDMDWAGQVHGDFWHTEMAIPLTELGIRNLVFPSTWKMRLVRDWKRPWRQAAVAASRHFDDPESMMRVVFDDSAIATAVSFDVEKLLDGQTTMVVNCTNPTDTAMEVEVTAKVEAGDDTVVDERTGLSLPADTEKSATIPLKLDLAPKNTLSVNVRDVTNGRMLYARQTVFRPPPEKKWKMPEADLTFYLSFDKSSLAADVAKGARQPIDIDGDYEFIQGLRKGGKALLFKENSTVTYDNKDNLTVPCAVSFWIQLFRERKGKERTYFWRTAFQQKGYMGIQDSIYGHLLLWLQYFPDMSQIIRVNRIFPWQQGRWFHIAVNISEDNVELYRDGKLMGQGSLDRPLSETELSPFLIGGTGYAMDELKHFSRTLTPSEVEQLALGGQSLDGKISWFPSLNSLAVEAVSEEDISDRPLKLVVMAMDDQQTVMHCADIAQADWSRTDADTHRLRRVVSLPELEEATYNTFVLKGNDIHEDRRLLEREFVVKHYAWENNDLGKSDTIIPPFTPIEVNGNTLSCVLRDYELGPLGLPDKVTSEGRQILHNPITLNVVRNGQHLSWTNTGNLQWLEKEPHLARFRAAAANSALKVTSEGHLDYAGLLQLKLTIVPEDDAEIDRVYLDVPVKKETARLYHAVGEHLRANPAAQVPRENGMFFESRSIPQPSIADNFIPYVWIGEERRGMSWVADWDKDWIHSETRAAVELIKQDSGQVLIRVNFINGPVVLKRTRDIEFGLMASPVKPMPNDWKQKVFEFDYPGTGKYTILWTAQAGFHYNWASRYPLDKDWAYIEKLMETRKTGTVDQAFIDRWIEKVMTHPGKLTHRSSEAKVRRHVLSAFRRAQKNDVKLLPYSVARERADRLPEYEVYGDEWEYRHRMNCSESFRDYAVWYAAKMMGHGMDGMYVDNTFAAAKYTWPTGEAYIGENGEIHPSLGILSRTRPLIRRLATMMVDKGHDPFVFVHMTNANILPLLSFAQANLGWEWKYGKSDFQEKFTPAYIRAVNIGQQAGTIPVVLGGVTGLKPNSEEEIRLSRTALAMTLPHHIFPRARIHGPTCIKARKIVLDFVARSAVKTHFYWDNKELVQAPENLMATIHRSEDQLLLVIGNLKGAGKYEIDLNLEKLGIDAITRAVNEETGETVAFEGNSVKIAVNRHDFALVGLNIE
ncbi:MAG: DUF6067 family protein [Candidatus Pacebacteria bacterium]|nr:DUF6067 family protein [Candidatus Paceibacterota bacterium]